MMKNRKGSSLVLVLMVFSVLMVLSTFIVGFMVTENKQSLYHQHKTQAYYIARSGAVAVEAAILKMDDDEIEKLDGELEKGPVDIDEIDIDGHKANVVLNRDGEELIITSKANVSNVNQVVTKVMIGDRLEASEPNVPVMEYAIFGRNGINIGLWSKPLIKGQIATNADTIELYGEEVGTSTSQEVGYNTFSYDIVTGKNLVYPNHGFNDVQIDKIVEGKFPNESVFAAPELDIYPLNNGVFLLQENKSINTSWIYEKFIVDWNKTLTIDTTNGDVIIRTKEFENRGTIVIRGNNKVLLYADKIISHDNKNIILDVSSNGKIEIYNSQKDLLINFNVPGDIYSRNTNLRIHDNRTVKGNIHHYGANNSDVKVYGHVYGDIFVKNGDLTIWYNGIREGNIYHLGDFNSEVVINGNIEGNVFIKEAKYTMHEDGVIKGSFHHFGNASSILNIKGSIHKDLFLSEGNIEINVQNNRSFGGHIYYNGNYMKFTNNNLRLRGSIYAPNAMVDIMTKITIEGGIVSNELNISGYDVNINGKPEYFLETPESEDTQDSEGKIRYKPGYFK